MSSHSGSANRKRPYSEIEPTPGIQDNNEDLVDHRVNSFPGALDLYTTSSATRQTQVLAGGYPGQQHLSGNRYAPQPSGLSNDSPPGMGRNYQFDFPAAQVLPPYPSYPSIQQAPGFDANSLAYFNPQMAAYPPFQGSGHAFAYDGHQPSQSSALKPHSDASNVLGDDIVRNLKASLFWQQYNHFLVRQTQTIVAGTPAALWDQGIIVQCAIIEKFVNFRGIGAPFSTPPHSTSPHGVQGSIDNGAEDDDDLSTLDDDTPSRKKPKISPKSNKKAAPKKTPKKKSSQKPRKSRQGKKFPDAPCADYTTIAAYAPDSDLATLSDCWNHLLYPADVEPIKAIEGDDWQDVRDNRKQEFIAKIYNELLHPWKTDPESYEFIKEKTINLEKYNKQQTKAMKACGEALGIPERAKDARTWCRVLVERVIFFHEHGLIKRKMDGHNWHKENSKSMDRKYEIDFKLICSARLEKIVEAVKYHKNVALDVATGENRDRIAEHPDYYLEKKFTMADSNHKRQAKVDKANQVQEKMREKATEDVQKKAKPRVSRAKPKAKALVDEEVELEQDETALERSLVASVKERARRSRKKVQRDVYEEEDDDDDADADADDEDDVADEASGEDYEDESEEESDEDLEPWP